jgi:hypothetical protein
VVQPHPDGVFGGGPASPPPSPASPLPPSSDDGLHTSGAQIRRPACSSHRSWQTAATHGLTALTWSYRATGRIVRPSSVETASAQPSL